MPLHQPTILFHDKTLCAVQLGDSSKTQFVLRQEPSTLPYPDNRVVTNDVDPSTYPVPITWPIGIVEP